MIRIPTTLTLLLLPMVMLAQSLNPRKESEKMNQRAQIIYYEVENQQSADSLRYYRNIMDVVDYSIKSDEFDRKPDNRGQVKLRHEKDNYKRVSTLRPYLIDAGLYLTTHNYRQDGINAWKLYIKASLSPLLKDEKTTDETGVAAFYIAQSELYARNYKSADRYADMAMQDDDVAQDAAEIKAQCMHDQMTNHEDSVKYLSVLAELYRSDPSNKVYFAWIMQFYNSKNRNFNLENFIDQQLQQYPQSSIPWLLKGETAMHAKHWEEAADAYKQANIIDPNRLPVIYNIGVCLLNWGIGIKNEEAGNKKKKKGETLSDSLFTEAQNFLESVRKKDPHRKEVDWVTPLYQIYILKGEDVKAEELRPLVKRG